MSDARDELKVATHLLWGGPAGDVSIGASVPLYHDMSNDVGL